MLILPEHADRVRTEPAAYGLRLLQFGFGAAAMGWAAWDVSGWRSNDCAPPLPPILTVLAGALTVAYTLYLLPITVPRSTFGRRFYSALLVLLLDVLLLALWIGAIAAPLPACGDLCAGCPLLDEYNSCTCPANGINNADDAADGNFTNSTLALGQALASALAAKLGPTTLAPTSASVPAATPTAAALAPRATTAARTLRKLRQNKQNLKGIKKGAKALRARFGLGGVLVLFFVATILWWVSALLRARKGEPVNARPDDEGGKEGLQRGEAEGKAEEHGQRQQLLAPVPEAYDPVGGTRPV